MAPRKAFLPNLPLSATVLSWGLNFVALKLLYEQMTAPAVALVRFLGMYAMLIVVCKLRGESLRYTRANAPRLLWVGFVSMGLYMYLFLEGMRGSSPAEGAIILATSPIFTMLLAVLLKQERFSLGALVGILVAFAGTTIVILAGATSGEPGKLAANLLVLASSAVWAYSAVQTRPLMAELSPTQALTLAMPGALLFLIPYGLKDTLATDWSAFTFESWLYLGHITFFAGVVGFLGFYAGVRQIGAAGAMLYQYFVPPTAAFFAYLLMQKTLTPLQAAGLVIVILGVAFSSRRRSPVPQTATTEPHI